LLLISLALLSRGRCARCPEQAPHTSGHAQQETYDHQPRRSAEFSIEPSPAKQPDERRYGELNAN
jgi:hypothetical protein